MECITMEIQYNAIHLSTVQCNAAQCNTNTTKHNTMQYSTLLYNLVVLAAKVIYTSSRNSANISHNMYHFVCQPYYLRCFIDQITFTFGMMLKSDY